MQVKFKKVKMYNKSTNKVTSNKRKMLRLRKTKMTLNTIKS